MSIQTSLQGIAKKASERPKHQFQDLMSLLTPENLLWSCQFLKKKAAAGVDKIDYAMYMENIHENIEDMISRLKAGTYKAKLVRRKWIPKGKDKRRPLGIPAISDKLLQMLVSKILQAIYEEDFLDSSFGYRPKLGALDAVKETTCKLQHGKYSTVVEADIKGFFDNMDHDWLIRMLEERIDDKRFLHLIRKWLRAGILEETGEVIHPVTGTPQGGVETPPTQSITLSLQQKLSMKEKFLNIVQNVGEIVNKGLHVTYKVLYLCHYEKIINDRVCQKNQFCGQNFIRKRNSCRSKRGPDRKIRNFRQTGVSLFENSPGKFRTACHTGKKSGFYSEAASQSYCPDQKKGADFRSHIKRSRDGIAGNLPENGGKEWEERKTNSILSRNTTMTGWEFKNLRWPINCLSLPIFCPAAIRNCLLKT
jgi:retron-type reverse transcriptase